MRKNDFLKRFVANGCYRYKRHVIDILSLRKSVEREPTKENAYRISYLQTGVFFIDPDNNYQLTKLEDAVIGEPLFKWSDKIQIDNTWIVNALTKIDTCIGNLLFNLCAMAPAFGSKIPFMTGRFGVDDIEVIVAKTLTDTPPEGEKRDSTKIYVDEYLKFMDALEYIKGWSQLSIHTLSDKIVTPPPGLREFKASLIKKYEGQLSDPVNVAKMEKELLDFDNAYIKDDPSYGNFTSGKMRNTVRKKLYLTIGVEKGFRFQSTVRPILNSLSEGQPLDPQGFSDSMNGLRIGSYSRGSETVNGGVLSKLFLRATNFLTVSEEDCGTTLGLTRTYTEKDIHKLVGIYIREGTKWILVTDESANKYINKPVTIRSPMYCLAGSNKRCQYCVGQHIARNKNGISIALTEMSGTVLGASMGAMHSTELKVGKLDLTKCFT